MKCKEVTAVFEWTSEEVLLEQLKRLKRLLLEGREYYEKVNLDNKMFMHFKQKYEKTRTFKVVNSNEIIIKSKI